MDRVILGRQRAVSTSVRRFQLVADEHFLGDLHAVPHGLAGLEADAASLVQGELGVDERPVVRQ